MDSSSLNLEMMREITTRISNVHTTYSEMTDHPPSSADSGTNMCWMASKRETKVEQKY
jgi:hypothetical protein